MNPPVFETLLLAVDARAVARLTLNRPDSHNALNATLIAELRRAVDRLADTWETDEGREGIMAFFAKRPGTWHQARATPPGPCSRRS